VGSTVIKGAGRAARRAAGTSPQPPEAGATETRLARPQEASESFLWRHLGSSDAEISDMLAELGYGSLEELVDATVPASIRATEPLRLDEPMSEAEALAHLQRLAGRNEVARNMIGCGYHGTITPAVIRRTILENPLWYTPYTPYQAEIAQGRLEALLNFQTMVSDLTALPLANASLLDEASAAAEAMAMCHAIAGGRKPRFYAAADCHPQTLGVVRTRADSMGIELCIGAKEDAPFAADDLSGILVQYPSTEGRVEHLAPLVEGAHEHSALVVVAADILALTLLRPPGEFGADIAVGSTQRFGVPMGYGGPHAAYLATHEKHARRMPGRLAGVSKDAHGEVAYRLAIQTREQHIRRDRATSNICTSQVLLAIVASMYAVFHGPEGLRRIARRVHAQACTLASALRRLGYEVSKDPFFDTIRLRCPRRNADDLVSAARRRHVNLRKLDEQRVGISVDETTTREDLAHLLNALCPEQGAACLDEEHDDGEPGFPQALTRESDFLQHPVFHRYHAEHEFLRYVTRLQSRDISLANSMIPLGSCTMKLNAAAEMLPVTWPQFANLHPHAPEEQVRGYTDLIEQLSDWLKEITGFEGFSMQPNAGSQGEYAGLLTIRAYHAARGDEQRDVCLIPVSAHGTNPASAVIAGFRVVAVECRENGDIDVDDLRAKAAAHSEQLGALMITYPSTHGVFEEEIIEVCNIIHEHGGQVYMDGANLNAQVGICRPGDIGADVCHLNLHKTFCIPHGGGGPGMGPIGVAAHLEAHLPGDPATGTGAVAAARFGSPSILPISWMYIAMMGGRGLTRATQVAILNANYMAKRLAGHFDVLYTGRNARVAHEFIIDCRPFAKTAGITVEDIAKRLMDYGFHAPTMSWPVASTLMIEPTESESRAELDRFCDALIAIRQEIRDVEEGRLPGSDNPLKHAPHTAAALCADDWPHAYSRERAAYPAAWVRERKFWPPVGRIDNAYGDRNLFCSCPPVADTGD
jgi:glycine dehydrogenase